MDDTIAKLLYANYSTPQSLHKLERPVEDVEDPAVSTVKALHNDYRAFTRNLKLVAPSTQIEERAGELDIDALIKDAYNYNYRPTLPQPEDDYAKLKNAYIQLLKAYNADRARLISATLYNYKISIVLNSQNKQREQSFPRDNIQGVRDILRQHERILLSTVESVIKSSVLSLEQKEQLLFQVTQAQSKAVADAKAQAASQAAADAEAQATRAATEAQAQAQVQAAATEAEATGVQENWMIDPQEDDRTDSNL